MISEKYCVDCLWCSTLFHWHFQYFWLFLYICHIWIPYFSGTSAPACTSGLVQKPRHTLRPWQRWTYGWPDQAWCRIRGDSHEVTHLRHLNAMDVMIVFNLQGITFMHTSVPTIFPFRTQLLLKILDFTQSHEQMCNGCRHCQANCSVQHLSIRFRQRLLQRRNFGEKTTLIVHPLFHDLKPYNLYLCGKALR